MIKVKLKYNKNEGNTVEFFRYILIKHEFFF